MWSTPIDYLVCPFVSTLVVVLPSSAVVGACDDVMSNFAVSTISISHAGDG